ncbi:MAG: hypothetical protein A2V88_07745 [Elusimicrobia bacterium RBG_16_66_12]|nr:MAG: hypothetical protein A2V88_07745 [Elusimicrobia bacterium RBG_16_66_12]
MPPSWLDRLQRATLLLTAFLYSGGYATAGLVAILLAVVLEGVISRRLPWDKTRLDFLIAAFIAAFLLSGALSPYRPVALSSVGLAALTIYLAYGLTARILRRDPRVLTQMLWTWVIGGLLTAVWAIILHFQTNTAASTPTLGQNAVGTTMVLTIVVALGLGLSIRTPLRYVAVGVTIVATAALLFTYARGAWLGLLASLVLLIGFGGRKVARAGLVAGVMVLVVGATVGRGERSVLATRALTILRPAVHQSRIFLLRSAVMIFFHNPVLGTGMNTFPLVYPRYRLPDDVNPPDARPNAHNIVLNMAAEGGLLGLGLFLAVLVQTFRLGWRWQLAGADGGTRALRMSLLTALAGILVHQLFDGTLLSVHLGAGMWMLIAVVAASDR